MLQKNSTTIKQYVNKEVTAVSKTVDSKKKDSKLSSFYTDIDQAFDRGLMASTIERLIREKGYTGSSSLICHYVSRKKKDRQCNEKLQLDTYIIQKRYIISMLYQSEITLKRLMQEESQLLFEQYPFITELLEIKQ